MNICTFFFTKHMCKWFPTEKSESEILHAQCSKEIPKINFEKGHVYFQIIKQLAESFELCISFYNKRKCCLSRGCDDIITLLAGLHAIFDYVRLVTFVFVLLALVI